ncbi:hypothetical protein [Hymenobacter terrenus]|uniref:hypothetical protein n=1 Tax=Hymenobacter terrenus TaxID=1629124 RepID=UPI000619EC74|nr:hypothetical protein [Hymenobacter terrenus]
MIYVFSTSVTTPKKARAVAQHLQCIPTIAKYSFDLDDCDHVLRIEAEGISVNELIRQINQLGFACAELPD